MTWDIHMYIKRVACLQQGDKINASYLIQKKVKNNQMKTNGVKTIFNIKL